MTAIDLELIRACGLSNGVEPSLERATQLIARGAAVDARSTRGATPLTEACAYGALDIVELLLDAGADPDLAGERDTPAVTFAATCVRNPDNAPSMVQLLVERGANVDARDASGSTTLLTLLSGNRYQLDVASLLVAASAELEYVGPHDTTALSSAAARGEVALVELLLARHAGGDGGRALAAAIRKDRKEVVGLLLATAASRPRDLDRQLLAYAAVRGYADLLERVDLGAVSSEDAGDALAQAASQGQLAIVTWLVEHGIDPGMDYHGREDPLMKAARYGHVEVADYLLAHHAPLEAVDRDGQTPLSFAAHDGRRAMLSFLLDRGADVHAANLHGWTALFQACARGHDDCARELIRRGAHLDAVDAGGATPLVVAAAAGRASTVSVLVDAGAALELHARNGRTALTWAVGNGHRDVVERLRRAGAAVPTRPDAAARGDRSRCAYCAACLSDDESDNNACAPCDASYCDIHYPWSAWEPEHASSDDLRRTSMCPLGHVGEERDARRGG